MLDEFGVPTSRMAIAQDHWGALTVQGRFEIMQAVPRRPQESIGKWHKRLIQHVAKTLITT